MKISRYLDHAVLKPEMAQEEARSAIQLGIDYEVRTVCVRPCDIDMAVQMCKDTQTQVSCVLDFPQGCGGAEAKEVLAGIYADKGVVEIDMVMNYGLARSGMWDAVEDEIRRVVQQAHQRGVGVKVIFETSELTLEQIEKGTQVCIDAQADFVKTSTGFSQQGATQEAVEAMVRAADGRIKVKPSGGIRDYATAQKYVEMGAQRLGVGYSSTPPICTGEGSSDSAY